MKSAIRAITGILPLVLASSLGAAIPDGAPFDAVLHARARNGGFDYSGAGGQDRKRLAAYLTNLGDADPSMMTVDERKAFYINAYNAAAIATVLDRYPLKSIRDIDGVFRKVTRRIGGEILSLDGIENKLREIHDARIHFAIVCASKSCPPLASKAYTAASISSELDRQGREFVGDPGKNEIDRTKRRVSLSKIFLWNRKEFERDGGGSLLSEVARFVSDPATEAWLVSRAGTINPEFREYDWALNQP